MAWQSKKTRWFVIAICLVGSGVFAFMHVYRVQASRLPVQEKPWPVSVLTLSSPSSHVPHLFLYGRVDHSELTQLSAAVSSTVSRVVVKEGDEVEAGQLLIELNSKSYVLARNIHESDLDHVQSELQSEQVNLDRLQKNRHHQKKLLDLAQASLNRYHSLSEQNYVSGEELNAKQREFNLRSMQYHNSLDDIKLSHQQMVRLKVRAKKLSYLIEKDQINLDHCHLKSPVAGQVTKLSVAMGERVLPGDFMVEVIPLQQKEVHALIPLSQVPVIQHSLDVGQAVTAKWQYNDKTIILDLIRLTPYVKDAQAGQEAIFQAFSEDSSLVMGVHAPVTVNLPAVNSSYVVPEAALYHDRQVYVVDNHRLRAVHVKVLGSIYNKRQRDYIIQSEGLSAGQQLITIQLPQAINGLLVSIKTKGTLNG